MTIDSTLLVQAACRRDREAFEQLALRNLRLVRAVIGRRVGPEVVDDLVQETFVDAWEKIETLRDPGAFRSWLARIAIGHACQWLANRERERAAVVRIADSLPESHEVRFGSGWSDTGLKALDALDPLTRAVVVLRLCEERSAKEVAAGLGLTPAAVDQRLARAKAELRISLKSLENRNEP